MRATHPTNAPHEPSSGRPRRRGWMLVIALGLALVVGVLVAVRSPGRPSPEATDDDANAVAAPLPLDLGTASSVSGAAARSPSAVDDRSWVSELATAPLAPAAPESRGYVVLWIDAPGDASLPHSLAVMLVPERGFPVRIERNSRAAEMHPVQWGAESRPPWVQFEDVDGKGRRLRFSGLPRGRWTAWAESRWERSEARFDRGVPPSDAIYAEPVSFEVGAEPSTITLTPIRSGRSAEVQATVRVGRVGIPFGLEIRTKRARWVVGESSSRGGDSTFALPIASWIPADEDVVLTPIWTSVPTAFPLEARTLRAGVDETRSIEWVLDEAVVVDLAVPGAKGDLRSQRRFGLRVTPLVDGRPDEGASFETSIRDGQYGLALSPGRFRFELGFVGGYGFHGGSFDRTIAAPGPVEIKAPLAPTFGPLDVVVREPDGRRITYRYEDDDIHGIDEEGRPRAVEWSHERPPTLKVAADECYLVASASHDDEDAGSKSPAATATRLEWTPGRVVRAIAFDRIVAPKGPLGEVEVFVVDDEGRPIDEFLLFAESARGSWGWFDGGHEGQETFAGLPVGRHRLRVARKSDALSGPFAAVVVVEVKEGVEAVAFVRLPAR